MPNSDEETKRERKARAVAMSGRRVGAMPSRLLAATEIAAKILKLPKKNPPKNLTSSRQFSPSPVRLRATPSPTGGKKAGSMLPILSEEGLILDLESYRRDPAPEILRKVSGQFCLRRG